MANAQFRIVLTGGPGGGKTTAADLFRRELGEIVVIVPEAATMLFSGGFPRLHKPEAIRYSQQAIFHVQRGMEEIQASLYPDRILLCDRGTVDGAAYWVNGHQDFFNSVNSSLEAELARYDAVVFFETAAAGGQSIEGGNPCRLEDNAEAIKLDQKLRALWSQHPNFILVPNDRSFVKKVMKGLQAIQSIVNQLKKV